MFHIEPRRKDQSLLVPTRQLQDPLETEKQATREKKKKKKKRNNERCEQKKKNQVFPFDPIDPARLKTQQTDFSISFVC
jgi:hypothetical protein